MPKVKNRPYSVSAREAMALVGLQIHNARIRLRMTADELAERAGVSRGLVRRIEKGDMGCSIGPVLELAAILQVQLLGESPRALAHQLQVAREQAAILPKAARASAGRA